MSRMIITIANVKTSLSDGIYKNDLGVSVVITRRTLAFQKLLSEAIK